MAALRSSRTVDDGLGVRGAAGLPGSGSRRIGAVGMSTSQTCGVRDHAVLLADALAVEGVACSLHWLWRKGGSVGAARSEFRDWNATLMPELERGELDAVLIHYSVFAYSYRGIPVFVHPLLSALTELNIPLVTVLHEYAYPWQMGGARGKAWALTQRVLLREVMRASAGVLVTSDSRADWLGRRVWLPHRPTAIAPVFSNLPPRRHGHSPQRAGQVIGLFGFGYEGAARALILDALRLLEDRGMQPRLMLLGAPGIPSAAADVWSEGARARDMDGALSFSGTLAAQDLSDALTACDVLLSADPTGPTSRKTTLAASLASGRPVIALDGRHSWPELVRAEAALVVEASADALADALAALLADPSRAEKLGTRGREFAEREMGVERSARVLARVLDGVLSGRA